jgi:hypothetical protein
MGRSNLEMDIFLPFHFDNFSTELNLSLLSINFVWFTILTDSLLPEVTDVIEGCRDTPCNSLVPANCYEWDTWYTGSSYVTTIPSECLKLPETRHSATQVRIIWQHWESCLGVFTMNNPRIAGTLIFSNRSNYFSVCRWLFFRELPIQRWWCAFEFFLFFIISCLQSFDRPLIGCFKICLVQNSHDVVQIFCTEGC